MIPCTDLPEVLARLRGLYADGATIQTAADELQLKPTFTFELSRRHKLKHRRRAMSAAKRRRLKRLLLSARLSDAQIAQRLQLSRATICRWRQVILEGRSKYRPRKLRQPVRCPNGHKVTELPCRTCEARG